MKPMWDNRDAGESLPATVGGGDCRISAAVYRPGGIVDHPAVNGMARDVVLSDWRWAIPFHCEYPRQRPALVI